MTAPTVTIRQRRESEKQDLLGVSETAELLGVERTRIARYLRQGYLPKPWQYTKATKLWLRRDIEEFKKRRAKEGLRR